MPSYEGAGREVPHRTSPEWGLVTASLMTCGMALYHFWLPYAFHWGDALGRLAMLRWGLFLLNASFSYFLLAGGVLTLVMAIRPGLKDGVGRLVVVAMAGYWLMNGAWQVLAPMPMPPALAGLRWAFLGFAVSVALLYASALVGGRAPVAAATPIPLRPRRWPGRHGAR